MQRLALLKEGEWLQFERPMKRKDGSLVMIEATTWGAADGHIQAIVRDITERKRNEAELDRHRHHLEELVVQRTREVEAAREQARRADRLASIGTFAAGVAHEINNPLGMMLLATDSALACVDNPAEVSRLLRRNQAEIERCGRIVRGVLDFSREQSADKRPLDLNEIVRDGADRVRESGAKRNVTVATRLAATPGTVLGNAVELGQVVVNLAYNAIQACGEGGHVTIETQDIGEKVRLAIRDDGCGMTPEQMQRIFDPFYTTRQEIGGTGLGLSIVHGIVTSHNGTIAVASDEGRGTTFTVEFGRHAEEEANDGEGPDR